MKLLRLTLINFKGIKQFELDAQGQNVSIYGDNATGKTSLFDAFTWLLFDKDSSDRTNFEIKTLKPGGQPHHGLDHEVEVTLEVNGQTITLHKAYKEKWTKKRGSATAEFTGHTTDYFINGVPVKKKDYDAKVAELADGNIFKLLTSPRYFNDVLKWQDRRQILLEVCGDISDADVIASDKALAKLPGILGGHSIEDYRKVIAAQRTKINKELELIPARIDEVTRGLPELPEGDREDLKDQLTDLQVKRDAKAEERTRIQAGGEVAGKRRRLAEVETALLDIERKARTGIDEAARTERESLRKVNDAIDDVKREIRGYNREIEGSCTAAEALDQKLPGLREKWNAVDSETLDYDTPNVCPTCGQTLPADQVQAAQEKALAIFNGDKAQRLAAITEEGKRLAREAQALRAQIPDFEAQKSDAEKRLHNLEKEAAKLRERISSLENSRKAPVELPPEHAKMATERDNLTMDIAQLHNGNAEALDKISGQIEAIDQEITVVQGRLATIDQHEKGQTRIKELEARERELAAEYERLEQELYLTEQFVRTKVSLLEDRINSKFKLARFRLFNVLVNGGIEECCETTHDGVPFGNLNSGARLNVGLDIINVLADHYNFAPAVWIDNAESVTNILPTEGQQIKLVVSERDAELRVEGVKKIKEAV